MSNVVLLDGVTLPKEPVPEVLEVIERLLDLAKDGHIRAVAVAGIYDDGFSHMNYAAERGEGLSRLIGATTRVHFRMCRAADE